MKGPVGEKARFPAFDQGAEEARKAFPVLGVHEVGGEAAEGLVQLVAQLPLEGRGEEAEPPRCIAAGDEIRAGIGDQAVTRLARFQRTLRLHQGRHILAETVDLVPFGEALPGDPAIAPILVAEPMPETQDCFALCQALGALLGAIAIIGMDQGLDGRGEQFRLAPSQGAGVGRIHLQISAPEGGQVEEVGGIVKEALALPCRRQGLTVHGLVHLARSPARHVL